MQKNRGGVQVASRPPGQNAGGAACKSDEGKRQDLRGGAELHQKIVPASDRSAAGNRHADAMKSAGLWPYSEDAFLVLKTVEVESVRFAIAPDCSECGDVDLIENIQRLKRSRVVSLWLTIELGICVIPLITFPSLNHLPFVLEGLKDCSVVAFSTKGFITNAEERAILVEAIRQTVDTLHLKSILVYDVCKTDAKALIIFDYAIKKGINIVIPENILKKRNKQNKKNIKGGQNAN